MNAQAGCVVAEVNAAAPDRISRRGVVVAAGQVTDNFGALLKDVLNRELLKSSVWSDIGFQLSEAERGHSVGSNIRRTLPSNRQFRATPCGSELSRLITYLSSRYLGLSGHGINSPLSPASASLPGTVH